MAAEYPTSNDSPAISLKKIILNTAQIVESSVSDVSSITGTANQVIASSPTGNVTLSLPQSIATTSDVAFNKVTTPTVAASTSAGLVLEAANGTGAIIVGPGNTANISLLGNTSVPSGYTMTSAGAINFSAGAQITSTGATFTSSGLPVVAARTTAVTNSAVSAVFVVAKTSGDAALGFGSLVNFRITDTGVTDSTIGTLGFIRQSADNTGDFVVIPSVGGSSTERFRVLSTGQANVAVGLATPAGGSTAARLLFGSTAGFGIYIGSGAPTVSAAQGSLYLRSDGTTANDRAYINTNGSTTWTALITVA